jgi:hypothetical protein
MKDKLKKILTEDFEYADDWEHFGKTTPAFGEVYYNKTEDVTVVEYQERARIFTDRELDLETDMKKFPVGETRNYGDYRDPVRFQGNTTIEY